MTSGGARAWGPRSTFSCDPGSSKVDWLPSGLLLHTWERLDGTGPGAVVHWAWVDEAPLWSARSEPVVHFLRSGEAARSFLDGALVLLGWAPAGDEDGAAAVPEGALLGVDPTGLGAVTLLAVLALGARARKRRPRVG